MNHLSAILLAFFIDLILGDPKHWPHPVKLFGKLIHVMDKKWNKGNRRKNKGILMVVIIVFVTLFISLTLVTIAYHIHQFAGIILEAIMIATTIAQKSLKEAAIDVLKPLTKGELNEAQLAVSQIVSRDTEQLQEHEIVRATVETVAENTSDGITAPLFWAVLGGAPLALVYRAVNTCDSMVGYKNEQYRQFGWASAKLDDVLNFIPARLTAFLMILVNKKTLDSFLTLWRRVKLDAKKHSSPNSGYLEASVAYILNIQLGGTNIYDGIKKESPHIGPVTKKSKLLHKEHIIETIRIMKRTVTIYLLLLIVGGICIEIAIAWFKSKSFI